ncbi:hypothetical protein CCHR01_04068 [Colletotrichum chrysophilum]|uniref:Uncharacterized protein n=1 Tax=Colletotrichum chrysophilum TaxID=1836956 RepID=A0AAD9ARR9_9PEZI|nr:hypothetical protein CCHR01_04068 [Colletotrichum chrysophilum]
MDRLRGEGKIPRGYQCQQEDAVAQLQTQVKSQRSVAQSGQATGQVRSGQVSSSPSTFPLQQMHSMSVFTDAASDRGEDIAVA